MSNLYVSFGQKYNLRNCLMVFSGKTEEGVGNYMRDHYGNRYVSIYNEEEAEAMIGFFDLVLVSPGEPLFER